MDMQHLISISTDLVESEYLRQIMAEIKNDLKTEYVCTVIESANDSNYSQVYQLSHGEFKVCTGQPSLPIDVKNVLTYLRRDSKLIMYAITKNQPNGNTISMINHFLDYYYMKRELMLVSYDELTKTKNRKSLSKHLQEVSTLDSVIVLDIDNFKNVNDTYGHLKGDKVLEEAGKFLVDMCGDQYESYRYGGDEFVILPKDKLSQSEVDTFASILHNAYSSTQTATNLGLSFSIGVAHASSFKLNFKEELIHYADQALYVSKFLGKSRVTVAKPSKIMFYDLRYKLTELWYALERGEVDNSLVLIKAPEEVNTAKLHEIIQQRIRKVDVLSQYGNNFLILFDNNVSVETLKLKYQDAINEFNLSIQYIDLYKNFNFYKFVNTLDKELQV